MNFVGKSAWSGVSLLALTLGVAGSLFELQQRESLLTRIDTQQQIRYRLDKALSHAEHHAASARQQNPKAAAQTGELAQALQRPWEAMLDSLQVAAGPDMQITRLQPEAEGGGLMVSGQADSSEAFLRYVQRVQKDSRWVSVVPVSEELGAAPTPRGKPVSFQVRATWLEHLP